tara:strand:- start:44983 stop:45126 length:144 start_codon:yes stop_codon:yes gene_type:complete
MNRTVARSNRTARKAKQAILVPSLTLKRAKEGDVYTVWDIAFITKPK